VDEEAPAANFASPKDKLILIVDDEETIRTFLGICLTTEGFEVLTAINGIDAAERLQERTPDLVVSDLMMPRQSGYEFIRTLPGAGLNRVKLFVITGSVLDDSTIELIKHEAGVHEFFTKPLKVKNFVAAVHKHLKTAPTPHRA
jgi:DNA-binding response OmpR family regulator